MNEQSGSRNHDIKASEEDPGVSPHKQICPSRSFIDYSTWSALDDVHSPDFQLAACECKPFLEVFSVGGGKAEDRKKWHTKASPRPEETPSGKRQRISPETVVESEATSACTVQPTVPSPKVTSPKVLTRAILALPGIDRHPAGVTGYRFIHLQPFQSENIHSCRGFVLRFPGALGVKSYKAKHMAKLIRIMSPSIPDHIYRYGPVWTATRTSKSSAYLLSYIHNKNSN